MGGKWLETVKEIAPAIARVALIHQPQDSNWPGFSNAIERVAPSFGVQLVSAGVSDADEIESAIDAFAKSANGGLPGNKSSSETDLCHSGRHRLPAIYPFRFFAADGGLALF